MYYIGIDWTDMKHDICILDSSVVFWTFWSHMIILEYS